MTLLEGIGILLVGLTVWLGYRQTKLIQASLAMGRLEALYAANQALLGTLPPSREALFSALEALAAALKASAVEVVFEHSEVFPTRVRWPELPGVLIDPLILPLQLGGQRLGELWLPTKRGGYSPEERHLLRQFTDTLASLLLNAQLYAEVSERRDELGVLAKLSATLNEMREPQRVFQVITRAVLDLTTAGDAHILLWDKREQVLNVAASAWRYEPRVDELVIRPHGLSMQVARLGEAVFVDDAMSHPLHSDGSAERFGIKARAALPLRHDEQVFGVIIAARYQPGAFSYREKRLLIAMADQAALAVYNAQLLEGANSRAAELESLLEVAAELTSTRRPEHTLRVITEAALDLCEVENAHIFLWRATEERLELAASSYREGRQPQEPAVDPLWQEVARVAQVRFVTTRWGQGEPLARAGLPLRHEGEVLGVLTVSRRSAIGFSPAEERILRGLADYGALAIQNARSHQELEALSELKSDFIATASHELKTPLMSLLGFAELLADHPLDETTLHYAVQAIQSEVDRMNEIIEALLNAERVRRELLPPQPTDILPVLRRCFEQLQATAKLRSIEVSLEAPQEFPPALLHPDQFALIVNNLFSNALKYSPEGSVVRVVLREEGHNGVLMVQDTGVGIAPEELGRLFARFYRVRKDPQVQRTRGTGLGLAIARETARRYGGDLIAQSDGIGAGSSFTVTFPVAAVANHTVV
ncbi:MAG: GAF domain-containing sensor histidine kinase [Truepera sp.]|nr:GAF domain-containing sensor histidine kinase [Truepera sp.]